MHLVYIFLLHFSGDFVCRVRNQCIMVFPCSKSCQMGIICRCGITNTSFTSWVYVAKIVSQLLNLVCIKFTVVPQHMIMGWLCSTLQITKSKNVFFLDSKLPRYPWKVWKVLIKSGQWHCYENLTTLSKPTASVQMDMVFFSRRKAFNNFENMK